MAETWAVLWDVDGTLVDTAEHHFLAWQRFAQELGHPFSREQFGRGFGQRNPEIIRSQFEPDADDARCQELGERKEQYYRAMVRSEGTALLPGVARLLEQFAGSGWPQAIGSSAPRGNLDLLLEVTGTARYFRAVVTGDDVRKGKPDPEVFLTGAAKLGVAPERCVVLEDAAAGVKAAQAAGMKCIAVTLVGHHPVESLRLAGADLVVPTLEAVTLNDVTALFRR